MEIPFYFDYACPWAYLASCRVEPYFRDLGVEIDFRPVILASLKESTAGPGPEPGERKKRNAANDLRHWAEFVGAEFSRDARKHRPDTRLLLAGALVAKDANRLRAYHSTLHRRSYP